MDFWQADRLSDEYEWISIKSKDICFLTKHLLTEIPTIKKMYE